MNYEQLVAWAEHRDRMYLSRKIVAEGKRLGFVKRLSEAQSRKLEVLMCIDLPTGKSLLELKCIHLREVIEKGLITKFKELVIEENEKSERPIPRTYQIR